MIFSLLTLPAAAEPQRLSPMDRKCQQEPAKDGVRCLEWRAVKIISLAEKNQAKLARALDLLRRALAISPVDLSILSNIAICYSQMGEYKNALNYCDKILKIKPSFVSIKFFKCMLEERLNYPEHECKECYGSVAQYYKDRLKTDDVNYVYAELMLGGPDAERAKKNFLSGFAPGSESFKMWSELLRNFDREKFLRQMLP
ncbi:tetratricopeptide repeat protein [Desulfoferula mesophila]|uniref:Tetratricopeptide repeat protein n=1 Tax=Desulfoferula mesophila TaxID=3058419 RepID=A0AAU9E778_9BACT|nr:hypothetical protein FAK_00790 [Desulfoferula mesophilus]